MISRVVVCKALGRAVPRRWTIIVGLPFIALVACRDAEPEQHANAAGAITETAYASQAAEPAVLDTVRCVDVPATGCVFDPVEDVAISERETWVLARGALSRIDSVGTVRIGARSGGGPGEVRAPIALGESGLEGDGVTVFDVANARLSTFNASDSAVGTSVMPAPYFRNMRIRRGALHAYTLPPARAIGDTITATILRYSMERDGWTDTVARLVDRSVSVQGDGDQFLPRLPWERALLWDVCGNGDLITAFSDGWTVRRFRAGTSSASDSIYRPAYRAEPMSDEEHTALSKQELEIEAASTLPAFRAVLAKRLAAKPAARLALEQLFCTSSGNAVVVNTPSAGATDRVVDVIGADGTVQRRVRVPNAVRLVGAYGERLVGVQEADEETSRIVRIDVASASKR